MNEKQVVVEHVSDFKIEKKNTSTPEDKTFVLAASLVVMLAKIIKNDTKSCYIKMNEIVCNSILSFRIYPYFVFQIYQKLKALTLQCLQMIMHKLVREWMWKKHVTESRNTCKRLKQT